MKAVPAFLASAATMASAAFASVIPFGDVEVMKPENVKRQFCEHTATSRGCWGDYSIDTNWYVTNFHVVNRQGRLINALGMMSLLTLE